MVSAAVPGPGHGAGSVPAGAVAAVLAGERLDWRHKGASPDLDGLTAAEVGARGVLLRELPTPLLTVDAAAVESNIAAMARWADAAGVDLCPHGKTSMAPQLWARQLAAGAWGITVGNLAQARVARAAGVRRVMVAHTLVHPVALRWWAAETAGSTGPDDEVLCWVDGVDVVRHLERAVPGVRLPVLVELGAPGRRTGARSVAAALEVARAVAASASLVLAGVCGYEGALVHDVGAADLAEVRRWVGDLAALHDAVVAEGLLAARGAQGRPAVLTAGGSAYFDLVAEGLAGRHDPAGHRGVPVRVVVRAGASVGHDDGFYARVTPFARAAPGAPGHGESLRAGLHGWASVVSRPEPGLALLDAGKRDLPFDEGLPRPLSARRWAEATAAAPDVTGAEVSALNDQHAFVRLPAGCDLAVGDVVQLGISHPCTAFDRWQVLPLVDDASAAEPRVLGMLRTFF